jgi:chromosome segregation ATPase
MPRKSPQLSIQELRRQLAARKAQLTKAQAARKKLAARLAALDKDIAALGGKAPSGRGRKGPKAKARAGKRKGKAAAKKTTRKRATGRPLVEYIVDVLAKAKDGMRIKNVMAAVKKAGYKSLSKDFYGIVAATLRDDKRFAKVSRGVYKNA